MNSYICTHIDRGVAQPGLEYASGGRGVGSSNLLTPTKEKNHHVTDMVVFCISGALKARFHKRVECKKQHPVLWFFSLWIAPPLITSRPAASNLLTPTIKTESQLIYNELAFFLPDICSTIIQ
jgi:hypothetical protein